MKKARDWWGLLWPVLPMLAGLAALMFLREVLPSNGMRLLLIVLLLLATAALLLWTFRSPNRSVGYLLQLMAEEPAKKAKGLQKLLSPGMDPLARERLMNVDFSKMRGMKRLANDTEGRAILQLWIGDGVFFIRLAHEEGGRFYWSVDSFWKNDDGPAVSDARDPASPYKHSRNVNIAVGTLSGVAAFFVFLTVFTTGDRIDRLMKDITGASVTALRGNTEMAVRAKLPAELEPFQDAVRDMTEEVQGYKIDFEESLSAIRYQDVLQSQMLGQDRDFGLENVMMTLRRGEKLAEDYFARIASVCNRPHMEAILDRHGVDETIRQRYFDGNLFYFEIGDTARFLKVYQSTTSLGEILQDHLEAWSIDGKNQLIFEDEAVMDQYNALYFEMQQLLQDMGGSALA